MIMECGWVKGYTLWVGEFPRTIDQVYIGQLCLGFIDVNVTNTKSRSGMAHSIVTFENLDMTMAAFERLQWSNFEHGKGQMHWPSVQWFKGTGKDR
jgi:hypothetical protein